MFGVIQFSIHKVAKEMNQNRLCYPDVVCVVSLVKCRGIEDPWRDARLYPQLDSSVNILVLGNSALGAPTDSSIASLEGWTYCTNLASVHVPLSPSPLSEHISQDVPCPPSLFDPFEQEV